MIKLSIHIFHLSIGNVFPHTDVRLGRYMGLTKMVQPGSLLSFVTTTPASSYYDITSSRVFLKSSLRVISETKTDGLIFHLSTENKPLKWKPR